MTELFDNHFRAERDEEAHAGIGCAASHVCQLSGKEAIPLAPAYIVPPSPAASGIRDS